MQLPLFYHLVLRQDDDSAEAANICMSTARVLISFLYIRSYILWFGHGLVQAGD